jgi:DNA-binding NarL/FixJ family response regulator
MSNNASTAPITVLIVEDDNLTRRALCLAIESEPTLKLVAALDSVKPALELLQTQAVDVLLTDLGLPDGSGLEVIQACQRRYPDCDMMVITASADEVNVLACIEAGASGYVLKDAGPVDVVRAILDLLAGGAPMSPAIARMVLARIRGERGEKKETLAPSASTVELASLTKREATILDLIARGDSYGEVARLLSVSVGTIQTHIKSIYAKLSVHSRGEAVFEAHRRGLLQLGERGSKA